MSSRLKIRRLSEERENSLSPNAQKSALSRGRLAYELPDPIRTAFQVDCDRIIHSKAFRRLKHKTQVFIAPPGDHYRTRLTHTLEVSQIARTVSRALNLNEDLAEAISLGHDLGHTPFGHTGEQVLNELFMPGFHHNEQSLRVVDHLEKLNLTFEVRDGIVNHSKSGVKVLGSEWGKVATLEGEIVRLADLIAWVNHDIDDAVRAGIIKYDNLPESASVLGVSQLSRIDSLVLDIIRMNWNVRAAAPGTHLQISMSKNTIDAIDNLKDFLFEKVYNVQAAKKETLLAMDVLRKLYAYFMENRKDMPAEFRSALSWEEEWRGVVDYIAGMTDRYALQTAVDLGLVTKRRVSHMLLFA